MEKTFSGLVIGLILGYLLGGEFEIKRQQSIPPVIIRYYKDPRPLQFKPVDHIENNITFDD